MWFVFGVQSRASLTVAVGGLALADGLGDAGPDDGDAVPPAGGLAGAADGPDPAEQAPTRIAPMARATLRGGRFTLDQTSRLERKPPLPRSGNGVESGRPASYTGMSRIRFGGSVALA